MVSLTRMAVASIAQALKIEDLETEIKPLCLVIGGGVAGMAAAEAVATRGVKVVLGEKEKDPGGLLNNLNAVLRHPSRCSGHH